MTAQFTNNIHIEGQEYSLVSDPLKPYLEKNNISPKGYCTNCWDGYLSDRDIKDSKLYLVDIYPCCTDEEVERMMSMENLFPDQEIVFAQWFSGKLTILKRLESTFEKQIYIEIKGGFVVNANVKNSIEIVEKGVLK